jgi:hypothetical protein
MRKGKLLCYQIFFFRLSGRGRKHIEKEVSIQLHQQGFHPLKKAFVLLC